MQIKIMPLGMVQANCYIISNDEKNAAIIDPGGSAAKILKYLADKELTVKLIALTHGHHDHIAALWDLLDELDVPVYIQNEDGEMLDDIKISLSRMSQLYFNYRPNTKYNVLSDGDSLKLDELQIKLIHTPGHTKGSSCYLIGDSLFTGDTLFAGDIGRTDLYGGDYNTMKASLLKLAALEGDYKVYPGHGGGSTLECERTGNPYLGQMEYEFY